MDSRGWLSGQGGLCQGDVGEGVGFLVTSMVFKKIGDECGGFVTVDEDTTLMTNLH